MNRKFNLLICSTLVVLFTVVLNGVEEHRNWMTVGFTLNRFEETTGNIGYYHPQNNNIYMTTYTLFRTDAPVLTHETAHAWHYNVIKTDLDHANNQGKNQWAWVDCTSDIDCRLRDKFNEYRESGNLSEIVRNWGWRQISYNTRRDLCREHDTDPVPDIWHYAECNPDEFFAVMSEVFIQDTFWFPYNKRGLYDYDRELYDLMVEAWRVEDLDLLGDNSLNNTNNQFTVDTTNSNFSIEEPPLPQQPEPYCTHCNPTN